jgi:hypothetical protein
METSAASKEDAALLCSPGINPFQEDLTKTPIGYSTSMRGRELCPSPLKSLSNGSEEPEDSGGLDVILWPLKRANGLEAKDEGKFAALGSRQRSRSSMRSSALGPRIVEDMIQWRLEEMSWSEERRCKMTDMPSQ